MSPRTVENTNRIKDERRAKILMAALRVFAEKGLQASKMSEIASQAGMSNGLAYHYFESKEALFHELATIAMDTSLGAYRAAAAAPGSAFDKIRSLVSGIVPSAYRGEGRLFFLLMIQAFTFRDIPETTRVMVAERSPEYSSILTSLIRRAQADGDVRAADPAMLAASLTAMIQGLAVISTPGYDIAFPDAETILRLISAQK
ncbi:MAG: hypothetical protein A2413_20115 [Treponema sp. RIFOXYC1_FULL_61_9]|nr:MAG: hypothetical protein A2413_20115 [Treponema sp. RIFOXYC1_FULL_61_9]